MNTFKDYAQIYLDESKFEHAHSSFISNRAKVKKLVKAFGKRDISSIKHSEIKIWRGKAHKNLNNKTINDHLSILRTIFTIAENDGVVVLNPMKGIKTLKVHILVACPFEKDELIALQKTETEYVTEKNLLFLAVLTGLRICEILALTWDCVDFDNAEIQINKSVVLGKYKLPKTEKSIRTIDLNIHAIEILKNQFEITGHLKNRVIRVLQKDNKSIVKQSVQHVFISSRSKKPFRDVKEFTIKFFKDFLFKAGVKKRGANQLRHTFASQSLTAGINMEWIRKQMGHTSIKMIEKHYGKWMNADAPDYSLKLVEALNGVFDIHVNLPTPIISTVVSSWGNTRGCKSTVNGFIPIKIDKKKMKRCA
jgi:integrase